MADDEKKCPCGNCCGCKGTHSSGACPHPTCLRDKPIPNAEEIAMFATRPIDACQSLRNRSGIGMMDAKRAFEALSKPENILDIVAEAERIGPGDNSHLQGRVENMERQIVERGKDSDWVQPLSMEEVAEQQSQERDLQIEAAARGERPNLPGQAPRVSDFFLIDTPMQAVDFLKMLNRDVLGHYDAQDHQGEAEFGIMVMDHVQGLPRPGTALADRGPSPLAKVRHMLIVKLDTGPWDWYDAASSAILASIVKNLGRRAWRCGWAIEKQWSWVEHWKVSKSTHDGKTTETIDGPANATVTAKALERWGIDVRAAFDDLMQAGQWEALRQWLLQPEPRPVPFTSHVSFLAGKLLVQDKDREWIEPKWKELFGDRKAEDGPLHLQAYYVPARPSKPIPEKQLTRNFHAEPPLLG